LSRSRTKATALSMALRRERRGMNGSAARSTLSSALNSTAQTEPLALGGFAWLPGWNSSFTVMPRGLRARGFFAISTRSGAITVRDQ
jgi:hypothetical protein